jgi:UDP-glucose 4-epimerase
MIDYLITGGNGFIGRNFANFIRAKGKTYSILDIRTNCNCETIDCRCDSHEHFQCIDVTSRLPIIKSKKILHLASETNVRKSIEFPRHTIISNTSGILNCLDAVLNYQSEELLFTSSASADLPKSPYLASKLACEAICRAYIESFDLKVKILRLSNVYGPHSDHKESVIARFIRNCIADRPLTIYGDGSQLRDFIYVDDVVNAIYKGKSGHIATGKLTSIKSIALMIKDISQKLIGKSPLITFEQPIQGEVAKPYPRTDIKTSVSIDEGLIKTFEWYLNVK